MRECRTRLTRWLPGCVRCAGAWLRWLLCGCCLACCMREKKPRYRAIPGTLGQFNLLVRRAGVKWVRNWGVKFLDVCLFAGAALVIGACPPCTTHLTAFLHTSVSSC